MADDRTDRTHGTYRTYGSHRSYESYEATDEFPPMDLLSQVLAAFPAVFRSALVGVRRGSEIEPVLCVELEPNIVSSRQSEVHGELLAMGARHPHTRGIKTILFHPGFPVDIRHNAKIFREKLALWASRKTL